MTTNNEAYNIIHTSKVEEFSNYPLDYSSKKLVDCTVPYDMADSNMLPKEVKKKNSNRLMTEYVCEDVKFPENNPVSLDKTVNPFSIERLISTPLDTYTVNLQNTVL